MKTPSILAALGLGLAASSVALEAQQVRLPSVTPVRPLESARRAGPLPFAPGEDLVYNIKLGIFGVGKGRMHLAGVDTVRGVPAHHAVFGIEGGIPFYKIDTEFQSWIDPERLLSLRFIQDQHEGSYERYRQFEFFPDQYRWERADDGTEGSLSTSRPLDDVSFVYFARTLPLEVGDRYEFNRYFQDKGNPVVIEVVGKGEKEVPAGRFETIVVRPLIRTSGLFGEGGKAELHFSDDERRLLVYMKVNMPGVNLTFHLEEASTPPMEGLAEEDTSAPGPGPR